MASHKELTPRFDMPTVHFLPGATQAEATYIQAQLPQVYPIGPGQPVLPLMAEMAIAQAYKTTNYNVFGLTYPS